MFVAQFPWLKFNAYGTPHIVIEVCPYHHALGHLHAQGIHKSSPCLCFCFPYTLVFSNFKTYCCSPYCLCVFKLWILLLFIFLCYLIKNLECFISKPSLLLLLFNCFRFEQCYWWSFFVLSLFKLNILSFVHNSVVH